VSRASHIFLLHLPAVPQPHILRSVISLQGNFSFQMIFPCSRFSAPHIHPSISLCSPFLSPSVRPYRPANSAMISGWDVTFTPSVATRYIPPTSPAPSSTLAFRLRRSRLMESCHDMLSLAPPDSTSCCDLISKARVERAGLECHSLCRSQR